MNYIVIDRLSAAIEGAVNTQELDAVDKEITDAYDSGMISAKELSRLDLIGMDRFAELMDESK